MSKIKLPNAKRPLALILAVLMITALLPVTALAAAPITTVTEIEPGKLVLSVPEMSSYGGLVDFVITYPVGASDDYKLTKITSNITLTSENITTLLQQKPGNSSAAGNAVKSGINFAVNASALLTTQKCNKNTAYGYYANNDTDEAVALAALNKNLSEFNTSTFDTNTTFYPVLFFTQYWNGSAWATDSSTANGEKTIAEHLVDAINVAQGTSITTAGLVYGENYRVAAYTNLFSIWALRDASDLLNLKDYFIKFDWAINFSPVAVKTTNGSGVTAYAWYETLEDSLTSGGSEILIGYGSNVACSTGDITIPANTTVIVESGSTLTSNGTITLGTGATLKTTQNSLTVKDSSGNIVPFIGGLGYSTVAGSSIAQIGTQGYATLSDAIAAAVNTNTVVLCANVTGNISIDKKIALDLNGYTLTGNVTSSDDLMINGDGVIKGDITATAGTITIEDGRFDVNLSGNGTIEITGGNFKTSPATTFLKNGYVVVPSGVNGYPFAVVQKTTDTEVVAGDTNATNDAGAEADDLTTALGNVEVPDEIKALANSEANGIDTSDFESTYTTELTGLTYLDISEVTFVVQPYLDIDIKDYDDATGTLTLDIKAMFDLIATTADVSGGEAIDINTNAVLLEGAQPLVVNTPVSITIPLDAALGAELYSTSPLLIKHIKSNGDTYFYTATVTEDQGAYTLSFTSEHGFSSFIVLPGGTEYTVTFDSKGGSAVSQITGITPGETITAPSAPSRSGYTFVGWYKEASYSNAWNFATDTVTDSIVLYAKWSPTGGGIVTPPADPVYMITITDTTNGKVTASAASSTKGKKITLTVTPDKDYKLASFSVKDKNGAAVVYADIGDGTYTFTMPGNDVTVTAVFELIPVEELPDPLWKSFTDIIGHPAYKDICFVVDNKLFAGTSATEFSPDLYMTRAMFVTVLSALDGVDRTKYTTSLFNDVPVGSWYASSVQWAYENGIVAGIGGGNFGPTNMISREQMAVIIRSYLRYKGITLPEVQDKITFADDDDISVWAKDAVYLIQRAGILSAREDNTYDPRGFAKRSEVASLFARLCEALKALEASKK